MLIFLGVPVVLPVQVLSFTKSHCHDFIANDEWPSVHPTSILREMLESYDKLRSKTKPSLQMHFSWFGLPYRRKPLTTL